MNIFEKIEVFIEHDVLDMGLQIENKMGSGWTEEEADRWWDNGIALSPNSVVGMYESK